jgi:rhamnulokinase
MGLWLLQECRRHWRLAGLPSDYEVLNRLAAEARPDVPLFDPDLDELIPPDDMPSRIAAACRAAKQEPPADQGEFVRSILVSLACKYRRVLSRLERVTGRNADVVHVIGGGARNRLLCQLTADMLGRPVLAGPIEATALGNILVQARSAGELGSLAELREVAAATARPVTFEPHRDRRDADEVYQRFVSLTGQAVDHQEPALT